MVEIRWSYDRLISTMGFPILVRWHLHIESGPRLSYSTSAWVNWRIENCTTQKTCFPADLCSSVSYCSRCTSFSQIYMFKFITWVTVVVAPHSYILVLCSVESSDYGLAHFNHVFRVISQRHRVIMGVGVKEPWIIWVHTAQHFTDTESLSRIKYSKS